MPMEYAPETRDVKPPGTPQVETVEDNIAPMYCACAATVDPPPTWSFDAGYWKCDRPDLPGHDVTEAPPTTTGLIPCQPVGVTPEAAVRMLTAHVTQEVLDERNHIL
jgi:hypothetical protein